MYNKKIFQIILKDKKNTDDKINLILLKSIGKSFLKSNINSNKIKKLLNN